MNYFTLQDLWLYDLSGNEPTKADMKAAAKYGLLSRSFGSDEWILIGSFKAICDYLKHYIGVEIVHDYLIPLKNVL